MYFNKLVEDLKTEGVTLIKIETTYEMKNKGMFRKKVYKEFKCDYYKLSW